MCAGVWVAFCVSDLTAMKISAVISVHGCESLLLIPAERIYSAFLAIIRWDICVFVPDF